jgi:hypothetical protein
LSEAVARFRGIAREVPPDAPVSIEELAIARPAFLTLIERLGEIVRQQWQSELSTKFGEVEAFCEQHNLRSFRESKPAGRERILGEYNVDWLHFQIGEHIFVLEPKGRFLPGAMGLVDIYDTTTGECISIYRRGENVWFIHAEDVGGTGPLPWDIVNFERALGQLMRRQVPR